MKLFVTQVLASTIGFGIALLVTNAVIPLLHGCAR
jgi:hypothetical protein